MTSWLADNLSILQVRAPELAVRVATAGGDRITEARAADGSFLLAVDGVPLHNAHAPMVEAGRWAAERLAVPATTAADALIVLGFGAGHHLVALAAAWPGRIVVVEPNAGVLRAALGAADRRELLQRVEVRSEDPDEEELRAAGQVAVLAFAPALGSDRTAFRRMRARLLGRLGRMGLRLKILVVSPVYGGSHPIAGFAARALADLGHSVTLLDVGPFAAGLRHLPAFGARGAAQHELERAFVDVLAAGVARRIEHDGPDLVLALAQAPLTPELLERLARQGVPTALWFVEDFRRFPYWQEVGPHYRYVFTIQREPCLEAFTAAGIANAFYLPCAADPLIHAPRTPSDGERRELGSAVSFVGAGYHNRRVTFRRLLGMDFKIWGSEWEGAAGLWGRIVQRGGARLSTEDCVRVFNAATVNLNLHSSTYVDGVDPLGDFVNPRTFELAACGAFQLVDQRRLLPELLEPGVEVATFASAGALRERIEYFLARPDERGAVAAAGRRRVLADHTYAVRMGEMLEAIFGVDYEHYRAPRAPERGKAALVGAAGVDTPLAAYLQDVCPDVPEVRLADITAAIHGGRGSLSEEEAIWVFLEQYEDMFLGEHRQGRSEAPCAS
jgi:spore maturation protein CgeB